jgi:FAD/FMN-containing dehydrogenase/catechol 2,3-dioxygenase-like lactoylglutathione lyase family enzyme
VGVRDEFSENPRVLLPVTTQHSTTARRLSRHFRGAIHVPGDDAYDAQRATWSGSIDQRPAIVAEAEAPADVRAAVVAAQEHGLPFAVHATGHGTHVPADGGLLLKTGQMAEVLVDPDRRIARVGPGARWGQVIAASAPFGLAPLSGTSPTVGVAGYTLGGGLSWLSRTHGFAADSLLRADVVTADGAIVTANEDRDADLLWALRGGGGNFGVVTSLELALHPVASVYAGTALFAFDRAAEVLARYREWTASQPDELTVTVVITPESVAIRGLYAGDARDAERAVGPLWEAAGAPLASTWRTMDYAETGTIGGIAPRHFELYDELSDAVIAAAVDAVAGHEADAVDVRHRGGAMARPDASAGPVGRRGSHRARRLTRPMSSGPRDGLLGYIHQGGPMMLANAKAFSGFAVDDLEKARAFYADTLGVNVELLDEEHGLMSLHHPEGRDTLVYRKEDYVPATYTVLNFEVDDIDAAVDWLAARGVQFERYDDFPQDEKGVMRGRAANRGPDIAWFIDPAGNILSVLQG